LDPGDFGEDVVCGGCPREGLGVGVPGGDVVADGEDQGVDGAERAAADGLAGDDREPGLDLPPEPKPPCDKRSTCPLSLANNRRWRSSAAPKSTSRPPCFSPGISTAGDLGAVVVAPGAVLVGEDGFADQRSERVLVERPERGDSNRPATTTWSGEVTSIWLPVSCIVTRRIQVVMVADSSAKSPTIERYMSRE
jgi:hypothetical protein